MAFSMVLKTCLNKLKNLKILLLKTLLTDLEGSINFAITSLLSMSAIFLLPRQFHTTIVENRKEKHLKTAIWLFPLYLLMLNFFVFPIAWGGIFCFRRSKCKSQSLSHSYSSKIWKYIGFRNGILRWFECQCFHDYHFEYYAYRSCFQTT